MRVVAGQFRSRTLAAPVGVATRPTSDRLRETLFNVLAPRIEGSVFLDLYAGSGAVGIEALSRGAERVEFVENAPAALWALRTNLARLGLTGGFRIRAGSVGGWLRRLGANAASGDLPGLALRFDLVFLDPPWDEAHEYAATLGMLGGSAARLLGQGALIIAEHGKKQGLEDRYGVLHRTRLLLQGDAALSFYALGQIAIPE